MKRIFAVIAVFCIALAAAWLLNQRFESPSATRADATGSVHAPSPVPERKKTPENQRTRIANSAIESRPNERIKQEQSPGLTPARLAKAVEHLPAPEASKLIQAAMERQMRAAWDARAALAATCLPVILGDYEHELYQVTNREPWVKMLSARCDGYEAITSREMLAEAWRQAEDRGQMALTLRRLNHASSNDGIAATAAAVDAILIESRDPYAIRAAALYADNHSDLWPASEVFYPPDGVKGASYIYQGAIAAAGRRLYCRLAGGCGASSTWTMSICLASGQCRPGAGYTDIRQYMRAPIALQTVDFLNRRIRTMRAQAALPHSRERRAPARHYRRSMVARLRALLI